MNDDQQPEVVTGNAVHDRQALSIRSWIVPTIVVVTAVAIRVPFVFPYANEYVYMLVLARRADATFLAGDWAFDRIFAEHAFFNTIFGQAATFVPIEVLAWLGRIGSWTLLAVLLMALAHVLGAKPWPTAAALAVFFLLGQSVIGGEWMVGTFEAKSLAYSALIGALIAALTLRVRWAIALIGLCFTLHPGVGLWGGGALAAALLLDPASRAAAIRWSWLGLLLAMPGVAAVSSTAFSNTPQDYAFVAVERLRHHTDPTAWSKRGWVFTLIALSFNLIYGIWLRREGVMRLMTLFQLGLVVGLVVGLIGWAVETHMLTVLLPARVFAVLTPLVFLLYGAQVLSDGRWRRLFARARTSATARVVVILGVTSIAWMAVFLNPVTRTVDDIAARGDLEAARHDGTAQAMAWISRNTPRDTVVILPPWRDDGSWLTKRAQIVSWKALVYEESAEWKRRLNDVTGDSVSLGSISAYSLQQSYEGLTAAEVLMVADDYGASIIVTRTVYPFDELRRIGDVHVYRIRYSG